MSRFSVAEKVLLSDVLSDFIEQDMRIHADRWSTLSPVEKAARVISIHNGYASWDEWPSVSAQFVAIAVDAIKAWQGEG